MKGLETVFDLISLKNTFHPDTPFLELVYLVTLWRVFSSVTTIAMYHYLVQKHNNEILKGRPEKVFQLTESHVSLLVLCSYWPWILCLKAHFLSVCMYVLVFQDQQTLPKWNILSDCLNSIGFALVHTSREFLLSPPSQTCRNCVWGQLIWGRY